MSIDPLRSSGDVSAGQEPDEEQRPAEARGVGGTPGIYEVYETESVSPESAPGFRTGVPAFLGYAERRPADRSTRSSHQMLTSWHEFEQHFAEPTSVGFLAYGVRGFFENGGRRCYVVRLDDTAEAAKAVRDGLDAVASIGAVDLVCAPDIMRPRRHGKGMPDLEEVLALQRALLEHFDPRDRRDTRSAAATGDGRVAPFVILDAVRDADPNTVLIQRQGLLRSEADVRLENGALYYPWIRVRSRWGASGILVPPSGHVAGVYARTDERIGVHKAPANEPLEAVMDVEVHVPAAEQEDLNPAGVNCLRVFPGRGIRVWGARTLSGHRAWRYVNVRRLFLSVGRWVEYELADVAFEPNSPKLWARIERAVTTYVESLFRRGALKGRTSQEAFYVKCDRDTNPREVREAGRSVVEIGLAPTVPSEFIVMRIIYEASGVTIAGPVRPG